MLNLFKALLNSFKSVLPIILVISAFQIFVIQQTIPYLPVIILGFGLVVFGLFLFLQGLELGVFPLGESLSYQFAEKGNVFLIVVFAFLLGYTTTIAEPALMAITGKAEQISDGKLSAFAVRNTVALGVAIGISLGVIRIILGHPIYWYICVGYILVMILTCFSPNEIIGLAYDSGGVTTSTITVPLVAALGIGLSTFIEGRDPLIDGFGLIAFASLMPILTVLVYGILAF